MPIRNVPMISNCEVFFGLHTDMLPEKTLRHNKRHDVNLYDFVSYIPN